MNNASHQYNSDSKPGDSEIEIHGQNTPDELLQFIQRHPELSNIPHGSVLEIHNLPLPANPKLERPSLLNQAVSGNSQIHLVPYVIPKKGSADQGNILPPGFTLEQLLNEFHKNTLPQNRGQLPFPPRPQIPFPNRLGLFPQQVGPILPNNVTYPG